MFERFIEPLDQRSARLASNEVRAMLHVSDRERWNARVLGRAPMLRQPLRAGDWLLLPLEQDGSAIPHRAVRRVRTLYENGIRPQGYVIIHEAPAYLRPGSNTAVGQDVQQRPAQHLEMEPSVAAGLATAALLLVVVPLAASVIAGAVAALAAATVVPAATAGIVAAALVDPMLVAVTEDGYWIVIDEWWTT